MYLENILDGEPNIRFLKSDQNGREINIYKVDNIFTSENIYYPNVLFKTLNGDGKILNPYREKIMSLQDLSTNLVDFEISENAQTIESPLFFFVYNTDNYYHFVYDSLPYLISFRELRTKVHNIKLLMSYPNSQKSDFYNFVLEFLLILGIRKDDILILSQNVLYSQVYFSNSFTHDIDSNLPPRNEVHELFKEIKEKVVTDSIDSNND